MRCEDFKSYNKNSIEIFQQFFSFLDIICVGIHTSNTRMGQRLGLGKGENVCRTVEKKEGLIIQVIDRRQNLRYIVTC